MNEEWRDIPNVPNYQASNAGRIRSLDRMVRCKGGFRLHSGRVLTPFRATKTGYLQVAIALKKVSAHRLIAAAWCDGFFPGAWVDHINGVRDDNRPSNLRWVTAGENSKHSYALGRPAPFKGKFSADHNTSKAVVSTCMSSGAVTYWAAGMDAVRAGFRSDGISRCCAGKIASHKGHFWAYAAEQGISLEKAE